MIVSLQAVDYAYPNKDAGRIAKLVLTGIDLDISAGKIVSILGPNGSGKSTILSLVAGLLKPSRGKVISPCDAGMRVPIVAQDFRAALFPWLCARDNIALPAVLAGRRWRDAREDAEALAAQVPMPIDLDSRPDRLSGGQAQMVALLRALMLESPLVLFDEPTSALDLFASTEIAVSASQLLRKRGTAALYVSHDVDEAILVADQVVLLSRNTGRVAARASVDLPSARTRETLQDSVFISFRNQILDWINRIRDESNE
jgi:NitT/TauT family transport system ATP-binding protein